MADAHEWMCSVRRIMAGNRVQFEEKGRAMEVGGMRPVVDEREFGFREALRCLAEGRYVGKV